MRLRLFLLIVLAWAQAAAKELQAGAASVELRPPTGIEMAGYGARIGVSKGTLDPLQAKILVLEGRQEAVALVTLDLVGVLPPVQLDQIRARVKSGTGIGDVIFNASHTHSGPLLSDDPPQWQAHMAAGIESGIERAWKSRRAARVAIGTGSVRLGHNRLYDMVVNYACHAVVLGPENLEYSADYPGEMKRIVERAYPGAVCLFVQGGAGNINPYYDKTPLIEDAVALMRETGRKLAGEVLRVSEATRPHAAPDRDLRIARDTLSFKARYDRTKVLAGLDPARLSLSARLHIEAATRGAYEAPVTTMLLGREFAFVGVPCEIFVDFQMNLRERVTDFPVIFAGYTNRNLGYVPTIRAAYLEVGAGNRMIDRAVIRLAEWTGKLQPKPAQPLP